MRQKHPWEGLPVCRAGAPRRSCSGAARRLGISASAASQAVRKLEARVGTPLLRRSTRSISLTDTGAEYVGRAGPALRELLLVTEDVAVRSGQPSGPLRLTMPRSAFDGAVAPVLARFRAAYPAIEVEIDVEGRLVDVVEQGFDAGLRYGDVLARDVVAVRLTPGSEALLAAAPSCLRHHPAPKRPADLLGHAAVMCRSRTTGLVRPWAVQRNGDTVQVSPPTRTVVGDLASQLDLMVRGLGIALAAAASLARLLDAGALVQVLPGWSMPMEPLYLYHPDRRRQSAALRAFIGFLRADLSRAKGEAVGSQP